MKGITPFLWFDDQAEEAANQYVSIFSSLGAGDSRITDVTGYGKSGAQVTGKREGSVMTVAFPARRTGHRGFERRPRVPLHRGGLARGELRNPRGGRPALGTALRGWRRG